MAASPAGMRRWIAMGDSLKVLRNAGLEVNAVLDVGVQYDTRELRTQFPDVPHHLFEPVAEYHAEIRRNYSGMDYTLVEAAVSRESGSLILEHVRDDSAGVVSHVTTSVVEHEGTRRVAAVSLDDYLAQNSVQAPYLLKIDVDGSETDILRGAGGALRDCSCLIIETTLTALGERCSLANSAGLRLWDIVDMNYYHGNLYQVDLVFVHQSQIERHPVLDPYELINQGLEPSAWFEAQG